MVLSDAGMIPRNHQVVETTADYNWLDRIINWGRAKIGMEPRPARIIYSLERKPPKDKGQPGFNEDPPASGAAGEEETVRPQTESGRKGRGAYAG